MHVTGTQEKATSERPQDQARLYFDLGPSAADPVLRVLEPGETVRSPETHLLLMRGDLDQVIQDTSFSCATLCPSASRAWGVDPLVEANHRGYIVDHESEAGLKREVDIAASVGADTFVIDAGWNGPEPNIWWKKCR